MSSVYEWPDKDHWPALAAHIKAKCRPVEGPVLVGAVFTVHPQEGSTWHLAAPSIISLQNKLVEAIRLAGVCEPEQIQTIRATKAAPVKKGGKPKVWLQIAGLGVV